MGAPFIPLFGSFMCMPCSRDSIELDPTPAGAAVEVDAEVPVAPWLEVALPAAAVADDPFPAPGADEEGACCGAFGKVTIDTRTCGEL